MSEREPLLESGESHFFNGENNNHDDDDDNNTLLGTLQAMTGGLIAPNATTYDSLVALLNEDDDKRRDELTEAWRNHKLEELNFTGIVATLIATMLASTGGWPDLLDNGNKQPWIVRAFWYSGIVFALFSLLIAAQQSLRLHRLSSHPDGLRFIRSSMVDTRGLRRGRGNNRVGGGKGRGGNGSGMVRPRRLQTYAWHASMALLTAAATCMVLGMLVLVWVSTNLGPYRNPRERWWDENAKLAVTFTIVFGFALAVFISTQFSMAIGRHQALIAR